MRPVLEVLDTTLAVLRGGFVAIAGVLAVVCVLDWLVRMRRLDPFGAVARFMRANVQPLIAPVERRVVRAGGLPSSAPLWALAFVVIAGIILLSVLDFARSQLVSAAFALDRGPRAVYRLLVSWTVATFQIALIVRVVLSWFAAVPGRWYVRWSYNLTEWMLRPLRGVIPTIGMIDITPLVAWVALALLQGLLLQLG